MVAMVHRGSCSCRGDFTSPSWFRGWRDKLAPTNFSRSLLALGMLLLCGRAAGSDRPDTWIQVRSPHFVVASDVGEKRARRIAQQFEQLRGVFHSSFPAFRADPGQPIRIVAVTDERAMT